MQLKIWDKFRLNEIRLEAKKTLTYKDFNASSKSNIYILYLYIIPIFIAILLLVSNVYLETEIANYFITSISIFAGLFFSLLFVVTDKYSLKREILKDAIKNEDDEAIEYLKRYKNFASTLVKQISYAIILAGGIIMLMSIIYFSHKLKFPEYVLCIRVKFISKLFINGLIYYLGCQFITFLIIILSNMYVMLLDTISFDSRV